MGIKASNTAEVNKMKSCSQTFGLFLATCLVWQLWYATGYLFSRVVALRKVPCVLNLVVFFELVVFILPLFFLLGSFRQRTYTSRKRTWRFVLCL